MSFAPVLVGDTSAFAPAVAAAPAARSESESERTARADAHVFARTPEGGMTKEEADFRAEARRTAHFANKRDKNAAAKAIVTAENEAEDKAKAQSGTESEAERTARIAARRVKAKAKAKAKATHGPLCKGECALWPARFACMCNPSREFTSCAALSNHSKSLHLYGTVEPTTYVQCVPPMEQLALLEKQNHQLQCVPPLIE